MIHQFASIPLFLEKIERNSEKSFELMFCDMYLLRANLSDDAQRRFILVRYY